MPSKSRSQQRLMAMALKWKKGKFDSKDLDPKLVDKLKSISKSMSQSELEKWASTKHRGLPNKILKESHLIIKFRDFI